MDNDNNLTLWKRLRNCCRVHWNGFFYLLSPVMLIPLVFMQPQLENRTLYLVLLAFLWYAVDVMPQGVTAVLPIIFYPIFGVLSSMEVCMSYSRDSQMVFMLSSYLAIAMMSSKLDRYIALRYLKIIGVRPARILALLMILTFILSAFIPDACACSIMIPIAKATIQILDEINVCNAIDERVMLKDDEKPYPSKEAIALYIGVGYAANIGGMTTLLASEAGQEFIQTHNDSNIFLKYIVISWPLTICLLTFTIVYLQIVFLGLWRRKSERRITFSDETTASTLETVMSNESQKEAAYTVITICLLVVYVMLMIAVRLLEQLRSTNDEIYIKFSAFLMLICLIAFVCPNNCSFLNYFICQKPEIYKMSPSILPWAIIPKLMPWSHFLVYGSSLAFGVALQKSGLSSFLAENLVESKNMAIKQLGFMGVSVLLTTVGANHLVANAMLMLGTKSALSSATNASLVNIPIVLASSLAFLLPVSSVANCFASGWGNLRSKDMIKAGIGPTVVGYFLTYFFTAIANLATTLFDKT